MKNVVCPISEEKVLVNIPRINAFLVVGLLVGYTLTNQSFIIMVLIIDFLIRGFLSSKNSPLAYIAKKLHDLFLWKNEKLVNKAPKIFAARLGFVFTLLILFFHFLGLEFVVSAFVLTLILFASLECALNFCIGCWVFTLFINPFYTKN